MKIASVAILALLGWIALKIVFGFAGGLVGLLIGLCWFALKVLLAVGLVYWLISMFSPDTARKIRDQVKPNSSI